MAMHTNHRGSLCTMHSGKRLDLSRVLFGEGFLSFSVSTVLQWQYVHGYKRLDLDLDLESIYATAQ